MREPANGLQANGSIILGTQWTRTDDSSHWLDVVFALSTLSGPKADVVTYSSQSQEQAAASALFPLCSSAATTVPA
jgi:hypothetical protein